MQSHTYLSIKLRQLQGKVTYDNRLKILAPGAVKIIRDLRMNRKQIKNIYQDKTKKSAQYR